MSRRLAHLEGKYEILGKIQERGIGAVYKVRHRLLDEVRAIKILRSDVSHDEALRDRLLREARTAIQLHHPNVVQIHDFSLDRHANVYLVMEYIEGMTLDQLLETFGPPPLDLAIEIATQAARALAYLHQCGYVHRDISPDNIMLCPDVDGQPLVKIIDLGIAKHTDDETDKNTFSGKIRYASPEAFVVGAKVDAPADLYSLGMVLYQLLTGKRPYEASSTDGLIRAHLYEPPIPFEQADAYGRIPQRLRSAIDRCLEKSPSNRPADANVLVDAFSALRGDDLASRQRLQSVLADILIHRAERSGNVPDLDGTTQRQLDSQFPPPETATRNSRAKERSSEIDPRPYIGLAEESMAAGRTDEAREAVEAALDVDPRLRAARDLAHRLTPVPDHHADSASDLDRTANEIRGLIEQQRLGMAAIELESARLSFGDQEELYALGSYLEHTAAELRRGNEVVTMAPATAGSAENDPAEITRQGELHPDPQLQDPPERDQQHEPAAERSQEAAAQTLSHLESRIPTTIRRARERLARGEQLQARALALVIQKIDPANVSAQQLIDEIDHELDPATETVAAASHGAIDLDRVDITLEPWVSSPSALAPDTAELVRASSGGTNAPKPDREDAAPTRSDARDLTDLALALAREGHIEEADQKFEQARVAAGSDELVGAILAGASQRLEALTGRSPGTPNETQVKIAEIRALIEHGELSKARQSIRDAHHQFGRLALWTVEAELDEAEATFKRDLAKLLIDEGAELLRNNQLVAAVNAFERASKLDSSNEDAWRYFTTASERLEKTRETRGEAFERAVEKIEALRLRGKPAKALRRLEAVASRWNADQELDETRRQLRAELSRTDPSSNDESLRPPPRRRT